MDETPAWLKMLVDAAEAESAAQSLAMLDVNAAASSAAFGGKDGITPYNKARRALLKRATA